MLVVSPIILILLLLAEIVPSDPNPQNWHSKYLFSNPLKFFGAGKDIFETSSVIPTVKCLIGLDACIFSKTLTTWAGMKSLPPKPYLPPNVSIFSKPQSFNAATTSKYNGSPIEPCSFVLSKTEILLTVFGSASPKALVLNGRYKWTFTKPYFPPLAFK